MCGSRVCDATADALCDGLAGGTNAYIWASWAFLEAKLGNVTHARQLYDASTVADPRHAAAWHGWGLLEKRQGNLLRARDLWLKVSPNQPLQHGDDHVCSACSAQPMEQTQCTRTVLEVVTFWSMRFECKARHGHQSCAAC